MANFLKQSDPEVYKFIEKEKDRQKYKIELIASENFVSPSVLEAAGSVLTNKYAEGYPYKWGKETNKRDYELYGRYYGGCEYVDEIEKLAIERACKLFKATHANVQPHSGSQANMAVYFATLKPGDTILSMDLSHGGHLSHGSPVNFCGIFYNVIHYGVNKDTEMIDFNQVRDLALKNRPKLIIVGASAYSRTIDFKKFREIANEIGAMIMVDIAHIVGLVATDLHPNPFPYAEFVTTTTHKTLRGPRGGLILTHSTFQQQIDKTVFPGIQGGPLMHIIAAKAVAFKEAMTDKFKIYQEQILKNAKALSKALIDKGFKIVSNGTDNHLMLVNLTNKKVSGKAAERALDKAGITVNKNTIPFDTKSPFVTSGIRLGTPAITSLGMKEKDMDFIAATIKKVLENRKDKDFLTKTKQEVADYCKSLEKK